MAEPHSLLSAGQHSLPTANSQLSADSQLPPLIHSLTANSQLTKFKSSKHARLNTADKQLEQVWKSKRNKNNENKKYRLSLEKLD